MRHAVTSAIPRPWRARLKGSRYPRSAESLALPYLCSASVQVSAALVAPSLLGERRCSANRYVAWFALVKHSLEEQSGRRRGEPRRIARHRMAAADLHERADDAAHHLPQEVRSFDADEHEVAVLDDVEALDEDERRLRDRAGLRINFT